MAAVTLRNLNKQFGGVRAVIELNLKINDGEFVTLLGPSGCDKTTTLNCIAGLEEATSGEILFDEQVVNDLPRDRGVAIMHRGVLQQYSPPHETYNNPANLFVAGFVDNPRIYFVEGNVTQAEGMLSFETKGLRVPLPGNRFNDRLGKGTGQRLLLGVRPEDVKVAREPQADGVAGEVFLVEPVDYLDLKVGKEELRASVDPAASFQSNETVAIRLNPAKLYLFDPKTGERLA